MKNILLVLAILTTLSFNSQSIKTQKIESDAKSVDKKTRTIDDQLNYRRIRQLQDNTLMHKKLNELVNTL